MTEEIINLANSIPWGILGIGLAVITLDTKVCITTRGYYNDYRVYHVETSIYNIKEDEDKSLVWVGSFDIVDPSSISATVNDYVERIVRQLEKEGLVDGVY